MRAHRLAVLAALAGAFGLGGTAQAASPPCDPFTTTPVYGEAVPTSQDVLGVKLGRRELSTAEVDRYLDAVDAASPRVVTGTYATSWQGRPLRFAIVGNPSNLSTDRLGQIASDVRSLRNPQLDPAEAAAIAARTPDVLYVGANVHGNEPSGTEATLRTLYELAARDDCAATQVLDNAIVVLLPIMNPDGREANTRRNAYWFDMNRDGWARTQPEVDGRIELERWLPPQMFADEHENGTNSYFFPPNNDPIFAEVPNTALDWIDHLYGGSLAAEFARQHIPYYIGTRSGYDLFAPEYGDTVPAIGFLAAGMTFEKGDRSSYPDRVYQHWVSQWEVLAQGAVNRTDILTGWHAEYVQAYDEGVAGVLEPNEIENPANTLYQQVPTDAVRNYYFLNSPDRQRELAVLVRRLQRMDVQVYQLTAALSLPDFKRYGEPAAPVTLPAGTYWVPMAQGQKHWIQAMLGEDPYISVTSTYDTTAWSNPLLLNLDGGRSGAPVTPSATLVPPVTTIPPLPSPGPLPRVAVFQLSTDTDGTIDDGWLRYLLDQVWHLPYHEITAAQIAAGGLSDVDVLLVPDGDATTAAHHLKPRGRNALQSWVDQGGRYVAWWHGVDLANHLGLTQVTLRRTGASVPGTLYRADVKASSPLATDIGSTIYLFNANDMLMTAPHGANVVVSYPPYNSADWFRSGFALRDRRYARTPVVVDDAYGRGHVISMSNEPDFRGYTDGTERLLWNAIVQPDSSAR